MLENNIENNSKNNIENSSKKISIYKLSFLIVAGIVGLYLFSIIASLIVKQIPNIGEAEAIGAMQFISYSFLFICLLGIINVDIKKLFPSFKKIKNYLFGLVVFASILAFSFIYNVIVNAFYPTQVNDNEATLRSFINIYPGLSILFLCFIGPICEELTYRVGLFGIFDKYKIPAYIIAPLIFALMHFNFGAFGTDAIWNELINLPTYIFSGVAFCFAYDKFGLAGSLTAHVANNLWAVIGFLIVSNI